MTFVEWSKWIMTVDSKGRFDFAHDDTPWSTWRLWAYYGKWVEEKGAMYQVFIEDYDRVWQTGRHER